MKLTGCTVLTEDFKFEKKDIVVENGIIIDITEPSGKGDVDLTGLLVLPGFIDVHIHGAMGYDVLDVNREGLEKMASFLINRGVTSFLPTTASQSIENIKKATEFVFDFNTSEIIGFHTEGPYFCQKYKGAQNGSYLKNPEASEFRTIKNVKMVSVAPELGGALEFIKDVGSEVCVSLGHSEATYVEADAAFKAGAKSVTHTFNGMGGLHHREPGIIGAAFDNKAYAQVICDGIHVHQSAIRVLYSLFGSDRMVLISDSMAAAGLEDGKYSLGGLDVFVKDGVARIAEGNLAGSTTNLWDCIKNVEKFGIPFEMAVKMATKTAALSANITDRGVIAKGKLADFTIIDNNKNIVKVMKKGKFAVEN